jgi:hypothetical protein
MNQPLLFDWTVLREIDASHPGEFFPTRGHCAAEKNRLVKMNAEQRQPSAGC